MIDTNILYDQKWHKLLKRSWPFKFFPFVDFVLVAGSMALGDINRDSDFDVIVGARSGRLYTARFFCLFFYKIFGWRSYISKNKKANRFCFNHFITEKSYCLQPPYNLYWQSLYANLIPVYGDENKIEKFFKANDWRLNTDNKNTQKFKAETIIENDLHFKIKKPSKIKVILEKILSGALGDFIEKIFKKYQLQKIKNNLKKFPPSYKPRIIIKDEEVELHLDTRRSETTKNRIYTTY